MGNNHGRKVSVIIPTWRRSDLLRNCLKSLKQQTVSDFETILVSNGAGDGVEGLAKEFGGRLVSFTNNRGFGAAINAGIAAAKSPYLALLNDDVELDKNWLQLLASLLDERPDISYCCGKSCQADGKFLDNAGDALSLAGSAWRLGFGRRESEEYELPRLLFAVPGTASLFRRSIFEELGGFDEDFFAYLEDIDFSLRAARAGYRGLYVPQATCRHHGSATHGGQDAAPVFRLLTQNQLMLLAKHYPWPMLARLGPRIAWAQLLWALMAVRKGRVKAYFGGVIRFLQLLPKTVRKRRPWTLEEQQTFFARLRESEREIYADIAARSPEEQDTFWKMYFLLFRPKGSQEVPAKRGLGRLPTR